MFAILSDLRSLNVDECLLLNSLRMNVLRLCGVKFSFGRDIDLDWSVKRIMYNVVVKFICGYYELRSY